MSFAWSFEKKIGMLGNVGKITIRGQQRKPVLDAGCSSQTIDRNGLDTLDSTSLPEFCRSDIGDPIKRNE
jgi:hypothetical protein